MPVNLYLQQRSAFNLIPCTMKSAFLMLISLMTLYSCSFREKDYTKYADPFAGTAGDGHCHPGACIPFGLVQAVPQTGNYTWTYTGCYQYTDSVLYGFTQTRINGTGISDMGDLLMLPFTGVDERDSFKSSYKKENQTATPGYYSVVLSDFDIKAEMTAAAHTTIHKYTFSGSEPARLMIDFQNGGVNSHREFYEHVLEAEQNFESPTLLTGYSHKKVWIERTYYYSIEFSVPFVSKTMLPLRDSAEKAHQYVFDFDLRPGEELMVKVALSSTGIEGAKKNMSAEIPGWDFRKVKEDAHNIWNEYLSRVDIEGTKEQKKIFYTAMYHLFMHPNNITDVNEKPFYFTLSLWDTYRAAHPIFTLLASERVDDFVNSCLEQYNKLGLLPIWALWGGETYTMIGNHAVPVIVDAYLKGYRGFDPEKAYEAVRTSLTVSHPKSDWETYDKFGYYPYDLIKVESVSRTLESCYDDYCAAQFAKALGKTEDYEFFMKRAGYYKNLFDSESKLMRPKDSKGQWIEPFDKLVLSHASTSGGHYTEGNAGQYTWHVQHDPLGLMELMGGPDYFTEKLDTLFTLESTIEGKGFVSDVSGLMGQYAQGNEPSHHVAYLYTLAGKPFRTAELVNEICKTQYMDTVDGLCGNDDCHQMSAWYIFSVMGFYPVNPCGGEYVIGAPQLPKATIKLANGKTFTVLAENYSPENIYVESVELNGAPYAGNSISHDLIMKGGTIKFKMDSTNLKYKR